MSLTLTPSTSVHFLLHPRLLPRLLLLSPSLFPSPSLPFPFVWLSDSLTVFAGIPTVARSLPPSSACVQAPLPSGSPPTPHGPPSAPFHSPPAYSPSAPSPPPHLWDAPSSQRSHSCRRLLHGVGTLSSRTPRRRGSLFRVRREVLPALQWSPPAVQRSQSPEQPLGNLDLEDKKVDLLGPKDCPEDLF